MPNFNRVILMGNLTRDPELRYTPSGQAVADIGIAVNRRRRSQDGERRDETDGTASGNGGFQHVAQRAPSRRAGQDTTATPGVPALDAGDRMAFLPKTGRRWRRRKSSSAARRNTTSCAST